MRPIKCCLAIPAWVLSYLCGSETFCGDQEVWRSGIGSEPLCQPARMEQRKYGSNRNNGQTKLTEFLPPGLLGTSFIDLNSKTKQCTSSIITSSLNSTNGPLGTSVESTLSTLSATLQRSARCPRTRTRDLTFLAAHSPPAQLRIACPIRADSCGNRPVNGPVVQFWLQGDGVDAIGVQALHDVSSLSRKALHCYVVQDNVGRGNGLLLVEPPDVQFVD